MSLAVWAASYDPSRRQAQEQLHALKPWRNGRVVHPFPYADRDAYKAHFTNREINHAIDEAPVRAVPLRGLHGIQHSVIPTRVEEYMRNPGVIPAGTRDPRHGGLVDKPIVVQYKGERYIHDGHHRCTAALLSGDKNVEARFVDLDKVAKE